MIYMNIIYCVSSCILTGTGITCFVCRVNVHMRRCVCVVGTHIMLIYCLLMTQRWEKPHEFTVYVQSVPETTSLSIYLNRMILTLGITTLV